MNAILMLILVKKKEEKEKGNSLLFRYIIKGIYSALLHVYIVGVVSLCSRICLRCDVMLSK